MGVAACKQSDEDKKEDQAHQDKRLKQKRKTRLTKRQEGEKKKEEMSSTLLLSVLLSSKQPDLPFQSSSCRAECQPSSQCNSPIRGSCPGWGEVCCQPRRVSSADRCSNFAEKGYSCVPKDSCRPGGGDLTRRGGGGAWCPGWEEVSIGCLIMS